MKLSIPPNSLPAACTTVETATLLAASRGGCKAARNRLVEGHLRLAAKIVLRIAREFDLQQADTDDMFGQVCWKLSEVVDDNLLRIEDDENPSGYLGKWIDGAARRIATKREPVVQLDDDYGVADTKTASVINLWDSILDACESTLEREVIKNLADGWKAAEIADKLGIGLATVYDARDRVRKRMALRGIDAIVLDAAA